MSELLESEEQLLEAFSKFMKKELAANARKGDITTWNPSVYDLIAETQYHIAKLTKAMLEVERGGIESSRKEVDEFSADVANFMAKTAQSFGTLVLKQQCQQAKGE